MKNYYVFLMINITFNFLIDCNEKAFYNNFMIGLVQARVEQIGIVQTRVKQIGIIEDMGKADRNSTG